MPKKFDPVNLLKVTMEFECDDGSICTKVLDGPAAHEWNLCIGAVCTLSHVHGMNPDWSKFKWDETFTKPKSSRGRRVKKRK